MTSAIARSTRIFTDMRVFLAVALNEPEKARLIEIMIGQDLIAPDVLPYELGNALSSLCRRRLICAEEALRVWDVLLEIPVELKPIEIRSTLELAAENMIYAYDAHFMVCSRHWRCPLLTLDAKLRTAAISSGIEVLEM